MGPLMHFEISSALLNASYQIFFLIRQVFYILCYVGSFWLTEKVPSEVTTFPLLAGYSSIHNSG